MKRTIIVLVSVLLGACVTSRDRIGESIDSTWLERRDVLRALDDWRMEGRIALRNGRDGYSGTLSWEQLEDDLADAVASVASPATPGKVARSCSA